MEFVDLGRKSFEEALKIQEETVARIAEGTLGERVHLVEHPHTFTVGRGGDASNLLSQVDPQGRAIELLRIGRGGDVTYHGPGQLVGYPHLDLRRRGRDVHRYLRLLEEALIRAVAGLGVSAGRRPGLTGVWAGQAKLASIGVGVRRWVTLHGFALNVSTDLRLFRLINPCGIRDCPMTSLTHLEGAESDPLKVRQEVESAFREVFGQLG